MTGILKSVVINDMQEAFIDNIDFNSCILTKLDNTVLPKLKIKAEILSPGSSNSSFIVNELNLDDFSVKDDDLKMEDLVQETHHKNGNT